MSMWEDFRTIVVKLQSIKLLNITEKNDFVSSVFNLIAFVHSSTIARKNTLCLTLFYAPLLCLVMLHSFFYNIETEICEILRMNPRLK